MDPAERDRQEREKARAERRREAQRDMRQKNMGHERRVQMMAREQNRDVSEKVALGLAKPTQNKEAMYDSRLFNQSSGFAAGFNEDQPYDKPLFAERDALNSIYRPNVGDDDDDDGGETLEKIQGTSCSSEIVARLILSVLRQWSQRQRRARNAAPRMTVEEKEKKPGWTTNRLIAISCR
jgi:hypothetical protein